ncbi:hypothetical protein [Rosistilla carotiformis]|nr:hypothetical protein [Rosistilla carotiformis]
MFDSEHFSDSAYHLNVEILLMGIATNGIVLVDADKKLYDQLCDKVEALAGTGKGKKTHILFEELLKQKRERKIVRFVTCRPKFENGRSEEEMVATLAIKCRSDTLIVSSPEEAAKFAMMARGSSVVPTSEYIQSDAEARRRHFSEAHLPPLDTLRPEVFDKTIVQATKFSKQLRFYDAMIGKGTGTSRFRDGIRRILKLWRDGSHFGRENLSAEIYTVVDKSHYRKKKPSESYYIVKKELVQRLQDELGIPINFFFKEDDSRISHCRMLQTESICINFDQGFDIFKPDGSFRRMVVNLYPAGEVHLSEYRNLPDFSLT